MDIVLPNRAIGSSTFRTISLIFMKQRVRKESGLQKLEPESYREYQRKCCKFVVETKVGLGDWKFSSSPRTDRERSGALDRPSHPPQSSTLGPCGSYESLFRWRRKHRCNSGA